MKKTFFLEANELNKELIQALLEKYPNGYDYDDIVSTIKPDGTRVKAIKVEHLEHLFYVKVSEQLETLLEESNHIDDIDPKSFDMYFDDYL